MASEQSALLLRKQLLGAQESGNVTNTTDSLAELTKHPVEGFSAGLVDDSNIYQWEVMVMGPPDTF